MSHPTQTRQSPRRAVVAARLERLDDNVEQQKRTSSRKRSRGDDGQVSVRKQEAAGSPPVGESRFRCPGDTIKPVTLSDHRVIAAVTPRGSSMRAGATVAEVTTSNSGASGVDASFRFHDFDTFKPFKFAVELRPDPAGLSFGDSVQGFSQPPSIIYDGSSSISKLSGESLVRIAQRRGSSGSSCKSLSLSPPPLNDSGADYQPTSLNYHSSYTKRSSETSILHAFRLKKQKLSHHIRSFLLLRPPGLPLIGTDGAADMAHIARAPLWLKTATRELSRESRMCPEEWRWSGEDADASNWTLAELEQNINLQCRLNIPSPPSLLTSDQSLLIVQSSPQLVPPQAQPVQASTTQDAPRQRGASAPPLMHANDQSFRSASATAAPRPALISSSASSQAPAAPSATPAVPPSVLKAQLLSVLRSRLGDAAKAGRGALRMKKFVVWNAWIRRRNNPSPAEISGRSSPQSDEEEQPGVADNSLRREKDQAAQAIQQGSSSGNVRGKSSPEEDKDDDMEGLLDESDEEGDSFALNGGKVHDSHVQATDQEMELAASTGDPSSISKADVRSGSYFELSSSAEAASTNPTDELYRKRSPLPSQPSLSPTTRRDMVQSNQSNTSSGKGKTAASPASPRIRASSLPLLETKPSRKSFLDHDGSGRRQATNRERQPVSCAGA